MPRTVLLVALALAPYAMGLLVRRAALKPGTTADQVWFPFSQRIQWLGIANLATWPTLFPALALPLIRELLPPSLTGWTSVATIAGLCVHILAFQTFVTLCVEDVNRRVRGAASSPESLTRSVARWGGAVFGIVCLLVGITAYGEGNALLALGAMLAGIGGVLLASRWNKPSSKWSPFAVTSGELRDRVFELATRAGVKLNQLYVLPTARHRMANALAVQNQTVMITD